MRISDWSSDVCSSDLVERHDDVDALAAREHREADEPDIGELAPQVGGRLLDVGEIQPFVGVEVENHAIGLFDRVDVAAPAVEFDRAHLDAGEDAVRILDIEIILDPAVLLADRNMVHMIAEAARIMLLEEE